MITRICSICHEFILFLGDESISGWEIPRSFTCKRCERKARR